MKRYIYFFVGLFVALIFGVGVNIAFASVFDYADSFEGYTNGSIVSQGLWTATTSPTWVVDSSVVKSGVKSLGNVDTGFTLNAFKDVGFTLSQSSTILSYYVYHTVSGGASSAYFAIESGVGIVCGVFKNVYGTDRFDLVGDSFDNVSIGITGASQWDFIELDIDSVNDRCRARLNGGSWSVYKDMGVSGGANDVNGIQVERGSSTGGVYFDDFSINGEGITFFGDDTRILDIDPDNGEVVASDSIVNGVHGATTTIDVDYYINDEDVGWFTGITVWITHEDQNYLYGFTSISPYSFIDTFSGEAGTQNYNTEIWLPNGGYAIHARLQHNILGIVNPVTSAVNVLTESQDDTMPMAQYHYYTVGENTVISGIRQNLGNELETILAGTSTPFTLADCNILSGFDFGRCVTFAFVPSGKQLSDFGSRVSNGILSKFPLGYVWNFYQIMRSTATSSEFIGIDAVIPSVLPGGNSHLVLGLDEDSFDMLFNATTSQFLNVSAPDDRTFYEITSEYWNIFVYLATGFYLIRRILGSRVIGAFVKDESRNLGKFKTNIR